MQNLLFKIATILSLVLPTCLCASSKLIVIEDSYNLRSSDFQYPDYNETLDVIWVFSHSIRLKINKFHLNGHMGDFVLISEYPLIEESYFKNANGTNVDNDYLANSIVTEQGLLLSWIMEKDKVIEAINSKGTFVLFHFEARTPDQIGTAKFDGFDIEILDYDAFLTTTTSTTPDPVIPPVEGQEIYISRFLSCKSPGLFMAEISDFKLRIADLATQFCIDKGIPLDKGDIRVDEVNVPGPSEGISAGLHYCDTTWPIYPTCVEVTFAIDRVDSEGKYILPKNKLEEMWENKTVAATLRQYGYCQYYPGTVAVDLDTLVWIAFFCGVIISLLLLLGLAWIRNAKDLFDRSKRLAVAAANKKNLDMFNEESKHYSKHYDEGNPINRFIPGSAKSQLYPNNGYLDQNDGQQASYTNPAFETFETVPAEVYAYDTDSYDREIDDNNDPLLLRPASPGARESVSEI